jgi:hypothetical protein
MLGEFIEYEMLTGAFFLKKNGKISRRIFPTEEGYLIFYRNNRRLKLKANKVAMELINNKPIADKKTILHKNLDENDYRLQNMKIIARSTYNAIKEAHRNLSGALKLQPHPRDMFCYILSWKEDGKDRRLVVYDVVVAKRMYNKLQLKYAKILSRHCVFD